jgi:predicted O-methyltransferase YrrM
MFHSIPKPMLERMAYLEAIDARDRQDGTPKAQRLRQIPPETGRFLALLAASAPAGAVLEIGTSGGYSSLWLILACISRGDRLTTFEAAENKVQLARETFAEAQVALHVDLIHGDARSRLAQFEGIAFCFLDAEKDIYPNCYDLVIPRLAPGGFFVADNVISHQADLESFIRRVLADERLDALVAPVGKGLLVGRRTISRSP